MATPNVFVKFDPERIYEVAKKLEQQHIRLMKSMANIKKKTRNLATSWSGDSSAVYLDKICELNEQGDEMTKLLAAFKEDLTNASGIYKAGESHAKQNSESLPADGVFLV